MTSETTGEILRAPRVVAFDFDGTILEPDGGISSCVIEYIRRLVAWQIICVTASGRPYHSQVEILESHGLGPESGCFCALTTDEREIFLWDKNSDSYRPDAEWNDRVRARWADLSGRALWWIDRAMEYATSNGWQATAFPRQEILDRGLATIVVEGAEAAQAVCEWLEPRLVDDEGVFVCNRNGHLVQICDARTGKGALLARLVRHWRLNPGDLLAFGDSLNDLSMLDGSIGFRSATVGNSAPEIKSTVAACGGYVARDSYGEGVVEALRTLIPRQLKPALRC